MRVLVIGGSLFIGAAVVRRLVETGHEVTLLNRGKSGPPRPDGVGLIVGDRAELAASRDAIVRLGPDVVLHNVVVGEAHARSAVDLLDGLAGRLVMTSSCDVYRAYGRINGTEPGSPLPLPLTEASPLREVLHPYRARLPGPSHPHWEYDKIPAEAVVLSRPSLPGTVLRLPMVLGPGDYQHRLRPYMRPMLAGRPAIVLDAAYASWCSTYGFVGNVAHAMALACTDPRAAGRTFNVGEWPLSTHELASAVAGDLGWRGEIVTAPAAELPEALRSDMDTRQDLVVSDAAIRLELGHAERFDFAEAIHASVQWEREQPPATPSGEEDAAVDSYLAGRSTAR